MWMMGGGGGELTIVQFTPMNDDDELDLEQSELPDQLTTGFA